VSLAICLRRKEKKKEVREWLAKRGCRGGIQKFASESPHPTPSLSVQEQKQKNHPSQTLARDDFLSPAALFDALSFKISNRIETRCAISATSRIKFMLMVFFYTPRGAPKTPKSGNSSGSPNTTPPRRSLPTRIAVLVLSSISR